MCRPSCMLALALHLRHLTTLVFRYNWCDPWPAQVVGVCLKHGLWVKSSKLGTYFISCLENLTIGSLSLTSLLQNCSPAIHGPALVWLQATFEASPSSSFLPLIFWSWHLQQEALCNSYLCPPQCCKACWWISAASRSRLFRYSWALARTLIICWEQYNTWTLCKSSSELRLYDRPARTKYVQQSP